MTEFDIPEYTDFDKLLDCLLEMTRTQHEMFKSLIENYDKLKNIGDK